jgi:hypothetical protein
MTQKVLDKGHPVCYTPYVKQKTFTNSGGQSRTEHGKRL